MIQFAIFNLFPILLYFDIRFLRLNIYIYIFILILNIKQLDRKMQLFQIDFSNKLKIKLSFVSTSVIYYIRVHNKKSIIVLLSLSHEIYSKFV